MEVGTKNPVLDLEALRVSISRTPSVLVILSTITAYIVKVFDKKPASFEVKKFLESKRFYLDFLASVGPALNSALTKKSWLSTNYVTDWWEEYVYLSSRDSLMINSNYFGLGTERIPSNRGTSRIAGYVWSILKWRKDALIDGKVPPIKLQKLVPLCPMQYKRAFGTNRAPGKDKDNLVYNEQSTHIAVFHKNALEFAIDSVQKSEPSEADKINHLPAGTALSREKWASLRDVLKSDAQNEASLAKIENALFHVWLDDEPANVVKPASMVEFARRCLHGSGQNVWFDKCFSVIASSNGHIGQNVEHTWADGAVMLHITEEVQVLEHLMIEYNPETGTILGKDVKSNAKMDILKWNSLEKTLEQISKELSTIADEITNLSLSQLSFSKFGKNEIKKWRLSPDAICQMAFQLTNFKIRNKLSMTYEAALARLFKDGRTETIRSCTTASAAFVKEMLDKNSDNQKRRNALKAAVTNHSELTKHAMVGEAVDRHLFALCVASRGLNMEHEFLNKYKKC
ncbi:unnamed protein product [Oikopleura dioica]|uniref:Choline/carnitine acyltransferase domain-containing protein n=1 Tax=Oikopleura dioica TaxID=34765 RepID=E4YTS1_OIKDI|nr:unnamed protein product [Oikopleura dioica]